MRRKKEKHMNLPALLSSSVDWVRAGYPDGVPDTDYVPLFALLGSQLSDAEIEKIADDRALTGDADSITAMHEAIRSATNAHPLEVDVARVRARLAAGGWPLAELPRRQ